MPIPDALALALEAEEDLPDPSGGSAGLQKLRASFNFSAGCESINQPKHFRCLEVCTFGCRDVASTHALMLRLLKITSLPVSQLASAYFEVS